ncbi:hypothetical protein BDV18DRAFT_159799 [Aspergillus unguis]
MAEAIGAASAITTFVTLALQATVTLYQTVQSIQTREKPIRELREQLQDLTEVLKALNELTGSTGTETDLAALERPLKRCASACRDFNVLVMECTQHSSADRYSKRDWLKIRYMRNDISGFRDMLAGYKSTISIALASVNLRTTKTTKHVVDEYKELIQNTQCDLKRHLEDISTKLEALSGNGSATTTRIDREELQRMEDERISTQKSLEFCQQSRTNYYEDVTAGENSNLTVVTNLKDLIFAKRIKMGNRSRIDELEYFFYWFCKTTAPHLLDESNWPCVEAAELTRLTEKITEYFCFHHKQLFSDCGISPHERHSFRVELQEVCKIRHFAVHRDTLNRNTIQKYARIVQRLLGTLRRLGGERFYQSCSSRLDHFNETFLDVQDIEYEQMDPSDAKSISPETDLPKSKRKEIHLEQALETQKLAAQRKASNSAQMAEAFQASKRTRDANRDQNQKDKEKAELCRAERAERARKQVEEANIKRTERAEKVREQQGNAELRKAERAERARKQEEKASIKRSKKAENTEEARKQQEDAELRRTERAEKARKQVEEANIKRAERAGKVKEQEEEASVKRAARAEKVRKQEEEADIRRAERAERAKKQQEAGIRRAEKAETAEARE